MVYKTNANIYAWGWGAVGTSINVVSDAIAQTSAARSWKAMLEALQPKIWSLGQNTLRVWAAFYFYKQSTSRRGWHIRGKRALLFGCVWDNKTKFLMPAKASSFCDCSFEDSLQPLLLEPCCQKSPPSTHVCPAGIRMSFTHLGYFTLPMTKSLTLWVPSILAQTVTATISLLRFPSTQHSPH